MKASVISQETHFVPVLQQSPAYQIANRIIHDTESADPALATQPSPKEASAPPLKVLQLQLDPPGLGELTIRVSLKDAALNLQIEASHRETARLIEHDREALTGMLRSAGYGVESISVQTTTGDRGNGAQQFSGGFNQSAGQHSAGRQPEGSGSGQAWQRAIAPETIAENGRDTEPPGAPRHRGGPVYL
jgi:chemotaxis protein MotD